MKEREYPISRSSSLSILQSRFSPRSLGKTNLRKKERKKSYGRLDFADEEIYTRPENQNQPICDFQILIYKRKGIAYAYSTAPLTVYHIPGRDDLAFRSCNRKCGLVVSLPTEQLLDTKKEVAEKQESFQRAEAVYRQL